MAFGYPLSLPSLPRPSAAGFGLRSVVGMTESPFTLGQEIQVWQGQAWNVSISVGPMVDPSYVAAWRAFFAQLNGRQGTFLFGDPLGTTPRGTVPGTPLIDGTQAGGGTTLATKGWTASQTGILKAGDYIQIGSGTTTRLHMVQTDANSDGSGKATLDIWPSIRKEGATNNGAIVTASAKGTFRLASNRVNWDESTGRVVNLKFDAVEAL